jgi:putative MFS transporter
LFAELADSIDRIPFGHRHIKVIVLVAAGMIFDIFESNALGEAGPSIIATFGISKTQLALVSSATYIGLALGAYLAGIISDFRGRKFSLILNLVVYSVGGAFCALSPSYETLVAARFIVGLGLGGELAVGIALVSEMVPSPKRASAVAALNVVSGGLGNMLAPLYAILVLVVLGNFFGGSSVSWRWLFGLLLIPVLLVLVMRRGMPESPRYLLRKGKIEEANSVLSYLSDGSVPDSELYLDVPTDAEARTDAVTEKVHLTEVFRKPLLRRTVTAAGAYFLVVAAQMSLLTLMPSFLVARGSTLGKSLVYTMLMQTGSLLGALAAVYTARFPRRAVLVVAAVLGCVVGVLWGTTTSSDVAVVVFGALFQFFTLLVTTTLWSWAPELYPTRVRGFGVSFIKGTGGVGIVVIPPLIAVIFASGGLPAVFVTLAIMFALIAVAALLGVETKGKVLEDLNEKQELAGSVTL